MGRAGFFVANTRQAYAAVHAPSLSLPRQQMDTFFSDRWCFHTLRQTRGYQQKRLLNILRYALVLPICYCTPLNHHTSSSMTSAACIISQLMKFPRRPITLFLPYSLSSLASSFFLASFFFSSLPWLVVFLFLLPPRVIPTRIARRYSAVINSQKGPPPPCVFCNEIFNDA